MTAVTGAPWRLPARLAFPAVACVPFTFFCAASAPSPTFILLQRAWGFSPALLTVAFAVYAIALLLSLLVAGSLSDHLGRRPVLLYALAIETAAMLLFLRAGGIGGLIMARITQGVATGIASGAMTAAVVEAAPAAQKRLGAVVSSVSPLAGLATGALVAGAAIRYAANPVLLVFGILAALFASGVAVIWFAPETVTPRPGFLASLVPHVSIPARARAEFLRGVPVLIAVWALGGLFLSLVPSLLLHVFGIDNGLVNGCAIATLSGVGAAAPTLLRRAAASRAAVIGMACLGTGLLLLIVSLHTRSVPLFFLGTAVAGIGFGGAFSAVVQILAPLAHAHERGELFAAIFIVSYLAFSLPAMAAGVSLRWFGLYQTVTMYAAALLVVALYGAAVQWRARRPPPHTTG